MKKALIHGLIVLFIVLGIFAFGPSVSQASAACRTINNVTERGVVYYNPPYEDIAYHSEIFTVPGSSQSTCQDINIRYLTALGGGYAWTMFRVRFYPSSGGEQVQPLWTYVDSWNSLGEDVEIATNVQNGTRYRIEWIPVETAHFYFELRD